MYRLKYSSRMQVILLNILKHINEAEIMLQFSEILEERKRKSIDALQRKYFINYH